MKLLLDTHIILWWLMEDKRLTPNLFDAIADPENMIYISAASVWEITIKKQLGKLKCPDNLIEVIAQSDFIELPINFKHSETIAKLPEHHKDPFDRMLIAQAYCEQLILLSNDTKMLNYNIPIMA